MKPIARAALLALTLCIPATIATAQATTSGKIAIIAADPDDFVVQLDKNGSCGSPYFHFQRVNRNFRESVALALTAYSTGSTMVIFATGCNNDRNIASHAYMSR